jgi:2-oxoglutarate ferredoxin oxidoreductase subunit alpha
MVKKRLLMGDVACAEGAIAAGCDFFAGYPITPATEIMEHMALRLPGLGGIFIQMEDEIASISACIGAAWGGARAMTATSGPGFSLMQEGIGYAIMTETPLVVVDIQRGGPSTGLPTQASQGDVMQARWGSHGDYEIIALAPNSAQEMYDLTIEAFRLSWRYRIPTIILGDAIVGHIWEVVDLKPAIRAEISLPSEKPLSTAYETPFYVPKFPAFGKGYMVHVSGLAHSEKGYPDTESPDDYTRLIRRLVDKIKNEREQICSYELINPNAKTMIITYGSPSRGVYEVLGDRPDVGLLRLKTVWPLHRRAIHEFCQESEKILVIELNLGQIYWEIKRLLCEKDVKLLSKIGGELPTPDEIRGELR